MKEIGAEFQEVMPQKEGGAMEMPTFFEKPSLWFKIKFVCKMLYNKYFNKNK